MSESREVLMEDVRSSLSDILANPSSREYNCHEIAKRLGEKLEQRNYSAKQVRGKTSYNLGFLEEEYQKGLKTDNGKEILKDYIGEDNIIDLEAEKVKRSMDYRRIYSNPHSWVEVRDCIVDFVPVVFVPDRPIFGGFTIIGEKKDFGISKNISDIEPEDFDNALYFPSDEDKVVELKI